MSFFSRFRRQGDEPRSSSSKPDISPNGNSLASGAAHPPVTKCDAPRAFTPRQAKSEAPGIAEEIRHRQAARNRSGSLVMSRSAVRVRSSAPSIRLPVQGFGPRRVQSRRPPGGGVDYNPTATGAVALMPVSCIRPAR